LGLSMRKKRTTQKSPKGGTGADRTWASANCLAIAESFEESEKKVGPSQMNCKLPWGGQQEGHVSGNLNR